MNYGIIYKVVNQMNGKIYIGMTIEGLQERQRIHLRDAFQLNKQTKFCRALRKYGKEAFVWLFLDEAQDKKSLIEKEKEYIKQYDSTNNLKGYNITLGGEGFLGGKHSLDTKEKMAQNKQGKKRTLESREKQRLNAQFNDNYGWKNKNRSQETKDKLSIALKKDWELNKEKRTESLQKGIDKKTIPLNIGFIVIMYKKGKTYREIAQMFKVSHTTIENRIKKWRLQNEHT